MANIQIPNLPVAIALSGDEQIEIVQAGASARTTTGAIAALAFVPPALTTAEKLALTASPGALVFDTDLAKLCVFTGVAWETITSA